MLHRQVNPWAWLWSALMASCWLASLAPSTALGQQALGAPTPAQRSVAFRRHAIDQWRTNRIIVKWRTAGVAAVQMPGVADRTARLVRSTGLALRPAAHLFGSTDVVLLDHTPSHEEMQRTLAALSADPAVEYAEPDGWRWVQDFPTTLPDDPHFSASTAASNASNPDLQYGSWVGQWYLLDTSSTTPSAISAVDAWQVKDANGNYLMGKGVTVAILDSGVVQTHPDLADNMVPPGYDFVSCDQGNFTTTTTTALGATQALDLCSVSGSAATYVLANDGGRNWHADGTDPGDWIDATDITSTILTDNGCKTIEPSSWHGTKVAGVLGAVANNGIGIAGVAPQVHMVSARVVGKCVARVSDIAAAILWASGTSLPISNGSIVSSPVARIINLSLGANVACSQTEQDAITSAINAGVVVVAAAGNEGGALDAPANCQNVISVVALRHTGDKVPFSNLSSASVAATIAAPGGNCVNTVATDPCLYDIETTTDAGITTSTGPFYTYALLKQSYLNGDGNVINQQDVGTSFSAPIVAGTVALMLQANPKLTVGQVLGRLQSTALPFPPTSAGSNPRPVSCALATTTSDSNGNFTEPTNNVGTECLCTTATCGAGMLNTAAAVKAAEAAFVQITPSSTTGYPGQKITLNGTGSTAATGHTIVSYHWATDPAISDQIIDADQPIATLVVPSFRSIGVVLTITDDAGTTTRAEVTIESLIGAAEGQKGGALQPGWLALLAVLAAWQIRCRLAARSRDPSSRALN